MGKLPHRDILEKLTRGRPYRPRVWQTRAVAPPSRIARVLALCLAEWLFLVPPALANPQGGVVHGGSAVITGQGTRVVTVQQRSHDAVLSWKSFNIQHGETTNFQQPSANAVAINRILDGQASTILGSLNATGHVYLINPNGIVFGKGSAVNAFALAAATSAKAGQLVALSRDGFDPSAVSAPGAKIVNQGQITAAPGGFVYLVAPEVKNGADGVIVAPGGEIQLAAGATVYLTDRPDGKGLAIAYTAPGSPGGAAVNLGRLVSDAGFVGMRAAIVRQSGVVEANSVREKNGKIELVADQSLELANGSVTEARGGNEGVSSGGSVHAYSAGDAAVQSAAVLDASGGAQGGAGGSIEVSAKHKVSLSGTFRVAGSHGARGGKVLVDPAQVEMVGTQTIDGGSGSVSVEASQTISLADGATVSLVNPKDNPTYALYSGGDIVFETGSQITDASSPGTAQNHWNVQLVAGASAQDVNLSNSQISPNLHWATDTTTNPGSGGIYLSGGFGTTGALTHLSKNGLVSLAAGSLTALAAGDIWIGTGGGLKDQTGNIDVEAGRNVSFAAGQTPQDPDSVIETGSGSIRVVAGNSALRPGGQAGSVILSGNAAIRTTDGGSIVVWAQSDAKGKGGNVDAGNANRWIQPGPAVATRGCGDAAGCPDIMPVVADGILGIGSQAGGNVTVVAGGNVSTGNSFLPRTGGSAGNDAGVMDYTGGHIGVFGQPVTLVPRDSKHSNIILANPPESDLLVVAGGNITGDYMVRQGAGVFRAGYALDEDPATLRNEADKAGLGMLASTVASHLTRSSVTTDPTQGWVGTLARPITFDLLFGKPLSNGASIDVLGANGVAVRAIESPSLVYPPFLIGQAAIPNLQVAGYSADDAAFLEAETGDVALLGNDIGIVPELGNGPEPNLNVRILPPSLRVMTHPFQRGLESRGGDFVMLNDFEMFPSASGGLTLKVAGQVRAANYAANGTASFIVSTQTVGSAALQAVSIPSGTLLVDPQTGLEFSLLGDISFQPRTPARPASGSLLFRATPEAANSAVPIPIGTRITDQSGQVYVVTRDPITGRAPEIPPPSARFSEGRVTFVAAPGASGGTIPAGTPLVTPSGVLFTTSADVVLLPGQREVVANVEAAQPGIDAAAGTLQLQMAIPGVAFATNRAPTVRVAEVEVAVQSVGVGLATNQPKLTAVGILLDPVPGIEGVLNDQKIQHGEDAGTSGIPTSSALPQVRALLAGPVGSAAVGHALALEDPSILPRGVSPQDVQITPLSTETQGKAPYAPAVFKTLDVERNQAGVITSTRIDSLPTGIPFEQGDHVWFRDGSGTSAALKQSDADPSYDARSRSTVTPTPYYSYYTLCHSGAVCGIDLSQLKLPPVLGTGPTHANDTTRASLSADGGFIRVQFDLAQPVMLSTKTEILSETTAQSGNVVHNGDIFDLGLRTEQTASSEESVISVPMGNASFGAGTQTLIDTQQKDAKGLPIPTAVQVPTDAGSGFQVSGPGSAKIQVGVVPFEQADKDGDGVITLNEFGGSAAVFSSLEQPDALGALHPELTAHEAPFVPTGKGGALTLTSSAASGNLLGIQTLGNLPSLPLPQVGASLSVVAALDILLQDAGFIGTLQGGALNVSSIGGQILGGFPSTSTGQKRGIVTFHTPSVSGNGGRASADASGGGAISVDSFGDFNIGGLALAALSGSDITINSRAGSVNAGLGAPFSNPVIFNDPNSGGITVQYTGSGVFAQGGQVNLVAKKDVLIGAGISGAGITINAGGNVLSNGTGIVNSSGTVTLNVGGTISGNFQALGSINIVSGSLSSAANATAGGLVTGAGATVVASNTGPGRASSESTLASSASDRASLSGGIENSGANGASGKRVVLIDVSSQPCASQDCGA